MPRPDVDTLLGLAWGWPDESVGLIPGFAAAANIVVGTNPPYSVVDFMAIYPKFLGPGLSLSFTLAADSNAATIPAANAALAVGQLVTGTNIPPGTTIVGVNGATVTLSAPATASGSVSALVYTAPLIPVAVLNVYITLASASLVQARYEECWTLAMALYIAHFATLWLESDGTPSSSAAQAAQQGVARGIQTAKAVGDTSVSMQPVQGIEDWGAWNLTAYGQQFATMARIVGAGPMLIW